MKTASNSLFLLLAIGAGCNCSNAVGTSARDAAGVDAAEAAAGDVENEASVQMQQALKEPTEFAPGCVHPAVLETCADDWCLIPAGCFLQGSPESEPGRAMYGEKVTAVTLSRPFLIQQHEVTQSEWVKFAGSKTAIVVPPDAGNALDCCLDEDCPAVAVNLVEAMAYANFVSKTHSPPLPPCFTLTDCRGPVSGVLVYPLGKNLDEMRMTCASFSVNAPSIYECEGFRLPTESEWEYAARAGSRSAYYSGELTANPDPLEATVYEDANLSPIAWYNWNSGNRTHPVMHRLPNAWGLFDVLGNMMELTYSRRVTDDYTGPVVDPTRPPIPSGTVTAKGGPANGWPGLLRAAGRFEVDPDDLGIGFRLARTLRAGEVWPSNGLAPRQERRRQ
jgi:formylglycine-generating enzyme